MTPFVFDKRLFEREASVIDMGDVASEMGPPTSIGGESAFGGLLPEFWDVLNENEQKIYRKFKNFDFYQKNIYFRKSHT